MKTTLKILFTSLVFLLSFNCIGQNQNEIAVSKAKEAIELMDQGKIEESRKLLQEAKEIDPNRFDYQYEYAYTYYLEKNYQEVINILEKLTNHNQVAKELFQLLGNSYDIIGNPKKAIEIYTEGLSKFPNAGSLYLEIGNVISDRKSEDEAIQFYEKGIEVDPNFPSNYYRAALYYFNSTEEVWGMMYGELFINLERNSKRTEEISKLLFDTYKSEIKFISDTELTVSFCQNMTMNINNTNKLPFCLVYEPILLMSIIDVKKIDLNTLNSIRTNFVSNFFHDEKINTNSNVLFDYQKKILDSGNLEAYNNWLLLAGEPESFKLWKEKNSDKWQNFVNWFKSNRIAITNSNKFCKNTY